MSFMNEFSSISAYYDKYCAVQMSMINIFVSIGIFTFLAVDDNLVSLVLLFLRLIMMKDQKMGHWPLVWG